MELLDDAARSAALLVLQEACESGDAHALSSAIAQAEKAEVVEDDIAKARVALAHATDREAASLLSQEAMEALLSAISASDRGVLKEALRKAQCAGVDACLLQRGQARLMELAEEAAREGQQDEFARLQARPPDARASKNLVDGAIPAKRVSVMAGEGNEDLAFALGAKKGQQGKSKKDGAARRDGPSMKGKALVDGGTLMLWKNSKAAGGSGGDSKADGPVEPAKPPTFAALPRH